MAGKFLCLVGKHFDNIQLEKNSNRQTIKVSYSTTANMENIISGHNQRIINQHKLISDHQPPPNTCNCKKGVNRCPLSGSCLTTSIVCDCLSKLNSVILHQTEIFKNITIDETISTARFPYAHVAPIWINIGHRVIKRHRNETKAFQNKLLLLFQNFDYLKQLLCLCTFRIHEINYW